LWDRGSLIPLPFQGQIGSFFANSETYLLVAMMAKRYFAKKALTTIQWIQGEIVINTKQVITLQITEHNQGIFLSLFALSTIHHQTN
jgi:hypothetical protein